MRYTIDENGHLVLPDGLRVGGSLYLLGTTITALPDGLTVGGDLDLRDTAITALPEDVRLGGKSIADAPVIPDIHATIYAAASREGALDMSTWHACATTHCRAGWAVTLAGEAGKRLESEIGTANAAMLIYAASTPDRMIPDFYASNETALADMKARAEAA